MAPFRLCHTSEAVLDRVLVDRLRGASRARSAVTFRFLSVVTFADIEISLVLVLLRER